MLDEALDYLVDEIFEKHAQSNREDGLTFLEWSEWFQSLDGIQEMLMTPSQRQARHTMQQMQESIRQQIMVG